MTTPIETITRPAESYLSLRESIIFTALLRADGKHLTSHRLSALLPGEDQTPPRSVCVTVCRMRPKLDGTGYRIITEGKKGYRLEVDEVSA